MEDIHSVGNQKYEKSAEVKEAPIRRAFVLLSLAPMFLVKLTIVILCQIYYSLLAIVYLVLPRSLKDIRGQLAVVTGGSNGIGREICTELARSGCNVACLDLDLGAAQQLCAELRSLGVKANGYKVDVSDYKQVEQVKKQINAEMGTVDILVNNAGLMPRNSFQDGKPDDIRRVMDVNVLAHFWTTRIFIGDMIARQSGCIVATCSMIAFYPTSLAATYATTKFAVKGFMDALNRESIAEEWGINTLTVFPHFCNTRREIIDYLRTVISNSTIERVGMLKPSDVGRETVLGIREGSRYVTVPRMYLLVGRCFQMFSCRVQDIIDYLFMPNLNSKYISQKSRNGCTPH